METALKVLIVAFTLAVGSYFVIKPEAVYAAVLRGRGRREGGAGGGTGTEDYYRRLDLNSIRSVGGFVILFAAFVIYHWATE